eukprot:GHUV01001060.1.p1 GENE.GHUV01001060.1~~GHUV01001060.1.p1  ORF type:complete len:719 (+),score=173.97 GHUV01001060.1:262-2418(+)
MSQALILYAAVAVLLQLTAVHCGPSYKPNSPLQGIDVWTNADAEWFEYPEASPSSNYYVPIANERPNFGIAVSGGGYRAVTLALGYVRALHMLNLTQQARYLSSNSGGSWFNSAFSYQQLRPVNEFLGPYLPPQGLGMSALKQVKNGAHGAFATTICESSIIFSGVTGAVVDVVTGSKTGPGAWSLAVGDAFLKPYNLNADKSTVTAAGTKGPIHPALQQLNGIDVYTYQAGSDKMTDDGVPRPFPIVLGTIFGRTKNTSYFAPIEFTPLYIGCPPALVNTSNPNRTVGGGFVDPQGFNSAPPNPVPDVPAALASSLGSGVSSTAGAALPGDTAAPVPAAAAASALKAAQTGKHRLLLQTPSSNLTAAAAGVRNAALNAELPLQTTVDSTYVVPLKVMMGISSSFLAQGLRPDLAGTLAELTGTEDLDYWNQINFRGQRQPFADGGGTDNLAITPLLRRGITNIVSCIAMVVHIDNNTNIDDWAVGQWDIAALFGAVPLENRNIRKGQINGMSPEQLNKVTQVFSASAWPAFFKALQASIAAGGPVYHQATYTVLDNKYQAIRGGWKVKVLWVANGLQKNWEKLLPPDTQGTLAKSRYMKGGLYEGNKALRDAAPRQGDGNGELKMFPYISTFDANYGPEMTGLLSQMATWQMLELKPQLQQLVAGSGVVISEARNVGTATPDKDIGKKPLQSSSGQVAIWSGLLVWLGVAASMIMWA